MNPYFEYLRTMTRRHFLRTCQVGIGSMALTALMGRSLLAGEVLDTVTNPLAPKKPPLNPKAKSVIYLHMAGAPSQLELFENKPELQKYDGQDCPAHLLEGKRFAFIKGVPRMLGTPYKFKRHGQAGTWVSELLPQFSTIVDDVAVIRSMKTDQFNHAPGAIAVAYGEPAAGSCVNGFVGNLRTGHGESGPAGLRRARERRQDAQRWQELVGAAAFCLRFTRGSSAGHRVIRSSICPTRKEWSGDCAGRPSMRFAI